MKNLKPKEAFAWLQSHPDALFLDVRMEIESLYVGRPPGVVNVPWYEYPDLQPDAEKFAETVAREATSKDQPLLLICRPNGSYRFTRTTFPVPSTSSRTEPRPSSRKYWVPAPVCWESRVRP